MLDLIMTSNYTQFMFYCIYFCKHCGSTLYYFTIILYYSYLGEQRKAFLCSYLMLDHIFISLSISFVFDVLAHNISIFISFLELTAVVAFQSVYYCVLEFSTRRAIICRSPQYGIVYCVHFHSCNTVVLNVHYNFVYEICNNCVMVIIK